MYEIYSKCHRCIIMLGGLTRLAGLQERNDCISRNWKFQEAASGLETLCVFAWEFDGGFFLKLRVCIHEEGEECAYSTFGHCLTSTSRSAYTNLVEILQWTFKRIVDDLDQQYAEWQEPQWQNDDYF